jgi:hypothetical protein
MRIEVQANTPEWLAQRHGCGTASNMHKWLSRLKRASNGRQKGDYKETRDKYAREIIAERLSGLAIEHFVTGFMQQGLDNEPLALEAYNLAMDVEASTKFGFALHPTIEYFGASLDATVGDKGGAEFKCFIPDKHLEIYETGVIPEENIPQLFGEMSCYELEWIDWVSYCGFGKWPREMRLFRKRLNRADYIEYNGVTQTVDSHIADIESEARVFLDDVILRMGKFAEMSIAAKKADAAEAYRKMEAETSLK